MNTHLVYLAELARLLLIVTLLAAALGKSADVGQFARTLADDFRVPQRLSHAAAIAIVGAEGLAVLLLLLGGVAAAIGAALTLTMLLVFSAAMLEVVLRRRRVYCQCFGRASRPVSALDLLRNAFYIAAAVLFLVNWPAAPSVSLLSHAALLLAATVCFLVSMHAHEIRDLLR